MYRILKLVMVFRLNFLLLEENSILRDLEVICPIIITGPVPWLGIPLSQLYVLLPNSVLLLFKICLHGAIRHTFFLSS